LRNWTLRRSTRGKGQFIHSPWRPCINEKQQIFRALRQQQASDKRSSIGEQFDNAIISKTAQNRSTIVRFTPKLSAIAFGQLPAWQEGVGDYGMIVASKRGMKGRKPARSHNGA
jgi:hypothetical protein